MMKNPNFLFAPTVIGFSNNILKERIIAIMKFKKPTTLTMILSALLVLGVGTTGAFAVTPQTPDTEKPEISVSAPEISEPEFTVTTSEPVTEIDETDSDSENLEDPATAEPEPVELEPVESDDTETLLLKWEDGLETPPDSGYLELSKSDENGNEIIRYLPLSESDETIVVCETAIKTLRIFNGNVLIYAIGHDSDENGNKILCFVPVHELMPITESTYAQEKILDDVTIRG